MEVIGRKWTMIIYAVPFALGNCLFLVAKEVNDNISLYFGRALTGFAGGAFALLAPVYISEIAEPGIRGALASLMQFMKRGSLRTASERKGKHFLEHAGI